MQTTVQTFEHERLWHSVQESAIFSMRVHRAYGHNDRFAPSQHDSFDEGASDESLFNRMTECVESTTKAAVPVSPSTASWIQMVDD